ncbi:MAG: hypothetical protein ABIL68_06530 [bacterium]
MGWKTTARSFGIPTTARGVIRKSISSSNQNLRDEMRRLRELERQGKEIDKLQEMERAAYEVDVYENHIAVISSIHKSCGREWNWEEVKLYKPPIEPTNPKIREITVHTLIDSYSPSFFDKTFKKTEKKKTKLLKDLEEAKEQDKAEHDENISKFQEKYDEWERINTIATKMSEGQIETYIEAIQFINPFEETSALSC